MADDEGFSLVEVVICVGLVVAACVASLAVVPTLVRASQSGIMRDAATGLARVAIERVRAATAYYPSTGATATHAYALNPSASYAAAVHVHRGWCDATHATTDVPMSVALTYDASTDTVSATVSYPRQACSTALDAQVMLSAPLAPSALAPGTVIVAPIDDPAQQ